MKKILAILGLASLIGLSFPQSTFAAGISVSGGGKITVGQSATVNIVASGAEFNAFQGSISVSGSISVTSFSVGSANWMTQPSANGSFSGALLGQKVTSFTIATVKVKGTGVGSGAVTVSGVILKNGAATVGTSGGSATITVEKAPDLPGKVTISSTSHPDQATAYEATTIVLAWDKASGVDGFSYLLDIKEPDAKIDETLAKPSQIQIGKSEDAVNNITDGTLTGISISGITEPGFTANLTFTPVLTVPTGKVLTALADEAGKWSLVLDYPVTSGFHLLTVQGQKDKVLTPVSDQIAVEISQKNGGTINILTASDEEAPVKAAASPKQETKIDKTTIFYGITGLALIVMLVLFVILIRKRMRNKSLSKSIRN